MNQVAFILENTTIYWHSIVLALCVMTGICFFMACCSHLKMPGLYAAATVLTSLVLSLLISRLMYWYSRADSFKSLLQALTTPASGSYSLAGVFISCALSALLMGRIFGSLPKLLDCMSVAGCAALCLGRLSNFFTTADRGQIVTEMTYLPWAYPVMNAASGMPDYRLATFVFQSIIAGILFLVLAGLFFSDRKKTHIPHGDITLLFLLIYSASQVLLDSTRYDSLYFRSNGFVSIVQVLCAAVLGVCVILISVRAARAKGVQRWMIGVWVLFAALFGLAGYMEYYVQRHGKLAFFSYSVMEHALVGILVLAIYLWRLAILSPAPCKSKSSKKKKLSRKAAEATPEHISEIVSQPTSGEAPTEEAPTEEAPVILEEEPDLISDDILAQYLSDLPADVLEDLADEENSRS